MIYTMKTKKKQNVHKINKYKKGENSNRSYTSKTKLNINQLWGQIKRKIDF